MIDLFELMRQAQGGTALDTMARQVGLSTQQAQAAVNALLPAFAMGLQRNAADPNGLAGLLGLLGSGRYNSFFQNPAGGFPPDASAWGEHALKQFFGNAQVTGQVASQAASLSGLAPGVVQQLLPFIAGVIVGGMVHAAANQGQPSGVPRSGPAPANPFEAFAASFMGRPAEPPKPAPSPEAAPANPFADMLAAMFAGARPASEIEMPPEPPRAAAAAPPQPEPGKEPAPSGPGEIFGKMMETGLEVQDQQLEAWKRLFATMNKDGESKG